MKKHKLVTVREANVRNDEALLLGQRTCKEIDSAQLSFSDDKRLSDHLIKVKSDVESFKQAFQKVPKESMAEQLLLLDEARDESYQALFESFKVNRFTRVENKKEAYDKLLPIFKTFPVERQANYEVESGQIDKLLTALGDKSLQDDLVQLNLVGFVEDLQTSQQEFEVAFSKRSESQLNKSQVTVKTSRQAFFESYTYLTAYVELLANMTEDTTYIELLSIINNSRSYYANIISHRLRAKKKAKIAVELDQN